MVGVAGAAANKRLLRLVAAELSSPSGRVGLAQAFVDGQLPSGVDGDGPLAFEYVNSMRDEPGVQSTGGRVLDKVGRVEGCIAVTQRGASRRPASAGDSQRPNLRLLLVAAPCSPLPASSH